MQEPGIEPDDQLLLMNVVSLFLQHDRFQILCVEYDLVDNLLEVFTHSYSRRVSEAAGTQHPVGSEAEELPLIRSAINQALSDISATAVFANKYPIDSQLTRSLVQWLSSPRKQMRICSCLVLGNLARSDPVCRDMVSRLGLHQKLLEILQDQSDIQVPYAALGFLRNLALPAENKPIIGSQGAVEVISTFWSIDLNPQVQHASVSLLRQLLNGCIGNVRWLLESLSPDPDSPAYDKTYLSLLLLLFGRTDDVATRIETGRTVATICRCISSASQGLPPEATSAISHRLYAMHADIAKPLAMMISQSRFPVVRSEGWFALALMARSVEGSMAASHVLQQLEVFGVLVSTITGQPTNGNPLADTGNDGGSGNDEMRAKDRENALVLVNELLKNSVRLDFLCVSILRRSSSD